MASPQGIPSNPFVGPRAFETGEILYGRKREIRRLTELLVSERILLMHSPSGAGKTSLIQAALIPELKGEGFDVLPPIRVGIEPPPELKRAARRFNRYVLSSLQSLEEGLPADRPQTQLADLAGMKFNDYLDGLAARKESEQCRTLLRRQEALRRMSEQEFKELLESEKEIEEQWKLTKEELEALPTMSKESLLARVRKTAEPLVLIFDQFEEILTVEANSEEARKEKEEFFQQVGVALRNRDRWALFSMREDYVGALEPYLRYLPTQLRTTFRLDLLQKDDALLAIQQPALKSEVMFSNENDDRAADKLIENLRRTRVQSPSGEVSEQPGLYIEPAQLQVVCRSLWEKLPWGSIPTVKDDGALYRLVKEEHVKGLEDVDDALGAYYAETVAKVAASGVAREKRVGERMIREWFERQLITEQGIRGQVLKGPNKSQGLDNEVIQLLVNSYLVRPEERRGATWYELAHDRLIGPVQANNKAWLEANLCTLQRQAALWESRERPEGLLLLGKELRAAEEWAEEHADEVTRVERDFLEKCRAAQREIDDQKKQTSRARRWAAAATAASFAALLAFVVALGYERAASTHAKEAKDQSERAEAAKNEAIKEKGRAEEARGDAERERGEALKARSDAIDAQKSAESARQVAEEQRRVAVQQAMEAKTARAQADTARINLKNQTEQTIAAQQSLLDQSKRTIASQQHEIENSRKIATLYKNLKEEAMRSKLLGDTATSQELAARARADFTIGSADKTRLGIAEAFKSGSTLLSFKSNYDEKIDQNKDISSSGQSAFTYSLGALQAALPDSLLKQSYEYKSQDGGYQPGPVSVAFDKRGCAVAADEAGSFKLWPVAEGQQCVAPKPPSPSPSPQDARGQSSTVQKIIGGPRLLKNIFTQRAFLGSSTEASISVALAADGTRMGVGQDNGGVRVFDFSSPSWQKMPGHFHGVQTMALSDDGRLIATATNFFSFKVSDVERHKELWHKPRSMFSWLGVLFSRHAPLVTTLEFSHEQPINGGLLALGDQNGNAAVRDALNSGKTLLDIPHCPRGTHCTPAKSDSISGLGFSPDNRYLAVADRSGTVKVWDIPLLRDSPAEPGSKKHPPAKRVQPTDQPAYTVSHGDAVLDVVFSPDGSLLATAGEDRTIKFWDVEKLKAKAKAEEAELVTLSLHKGFVNDLAFYKVNEQEALLASVSADNTVKIWGPLSLDRLQKLKELQRAVEEEKKKQDLGNSDMSGLLDRIRSFIGVWSPDDCKRIEATSGLKFPDLCSTPPR
jgi:WD40 repeat protein